MHSRTNGRRERAGDAETTVNLTSSFLFFYALPKQTCFRNCFVFSSTLLPSVRSSVPIALMLRPSVRPSVRSSIRAEAGEICGKERIGANGRSPSFPKMCCSRALLLTRARPSVLSSLRPFAPPSRPFFRPNRNRRDFAATNALEERAGALYFSERFA